ncbi:hypothetical protein COHA_002740 [Chlorella ohadii]|uniref:Sulfotransferase n=1 Tax=Chlorella ohadii TaxID=2649997 RepID=A0AAD5DSH3_9CHLO|nr:hypothetical protein COHA_002740 [Chlorella ohadii]
MARSRAKSSSGTPSRAAIEANPRLPRLPLAAAVAVLLLALAAAWVARPAAQRSQPASQQAASRIRDQPTAPSIDWNSAEWQQQRLAGRRPKPPPLCTILWNDDYRLIFLKCAKNAGNSVAHYFGARWQGSDKPTALNVLEPLWHSSLVSQLLQKWSSYSVFTFVRHPLRRAFSQYAFMSAALASDEGCYVPWRDFCRDPFLLGDACVKRPHCCTRFNIPDQYFHLLPQASCLLTERGQLAVDFVGRVESFEEDFAALLAFLNARKGVPKVPVGPAQVWNANRMGRCHDDIVASRLAAGVVPGAVPNPCNRSLLFEGPYAHCRNGLTAFYDQDVRLLMS